MSYIQVQEIVTHRGKCFPVDTIRIDNDVNPYGDSYSDAMESLGEPLARIIRSVGRSIEGSYTINLRQDAKNYQAEVVTLNPNNANLPLTRTQIFGSVVLGENSGVLEITSDGDNFRTRLTFVDDRS